MELIEFCRGRWGKVVYATELSGANRAAEFYEGLSAVDQVKVGALFARFAELGEIRNREKFKKISADLFEFKSGQVRMFCFLEHGTVVVTHGCIKKRDELSRTDIDRAMRIRDEHRKVHNSTAAKPGAPRSKK